MASFFNNYFLIILSVVAGMMIPTQTGVNNKLATFVESLILADFAGK